MTTYYLGVDTGATKSEALLANERGQVLGYGRAGPGNWETVGWQGARQVLQTIIGQAVTRAGITIPDIRASGLGLAGYDWPEDYEPHLALLRELGLRGALNIVNDSFLGLFAGSEMGFGVVVSAGTSCNCYGRDAAGRIGRMAGSSRFGEYAGAGEIVEYALQAVSRAWSKRGPQTELAHYFLSAVGAADVDDLLAGLMRDRYTIDARHAHLVFEAAHGGDEVAIEAVNWAGIQLGELANGVIRQLNLGGQEFDVVLSGSLFKGSRRLQPLVADGVALEAPGARITRLTAPPVCGGVLLALEQDCAISPQIRWTLQESTAAVQSPLDAAG